MGGLAWLQPALLWGLPLVALPILAHLFLRARAVAVFPGGFGTFDEMFELLTLIQTGKIKPIPVLLFGRDFWTRVINFDALVDEGVISAHDINLFRFVETAEEAWDAVQHFYNGGDA